MHTGVFACRRRRGPTSRYQHGGEASTEVAPSSGFREGEVRGQVLLAMSTGSADITAVEAVKEQSSHGIQKPPRMVGKKWFPGACWMAPESLRWRRYQRVSKQDPLGASGPSWW
jgi:hypothetical protein